MSSVKWAEEGLLSWVLVLTPRQFARAGEQQGVEKQVASLTPLPPARFLPGKEGSGTCLPFPREQGAPQGGAGGRGMAPGASAQNNATLHHPRRGEMGPLAHKEERRKERWKA